MDDSGSYEVVLLIERGLADADAEMLAELYGELETSTHLHVLMPARDTWPVADAGGRPLLFGTDIEAWSMPDISAASAARDEELVDEAKEDAAATLSRSLSRLRAHGFEADGETVAHDPLEALRAVVTARHSEEVVILTKTHPISEMLRTDWTARARRHLDVPVLHLLEHAEG